MLRVVSSMRMGIMLNMNGDNKTMALGVARDPRGDRRLSPRDALLSPDSFEAGELAESCLLLRSTGKGLLGTAVVYKNLILGVIRSVSCILLSTTTSTLTQYRR